jgi:hypothetical protein
LFDALGCDAVRLLAEVSTDRLAELVGAGALGYTVRVVPHHAGLTGDAELGLQALAF